MASCYALVTAAGCGGFGEEGVQAAPDAQAESASDALVQTDATGDDAATIADAATGDALTDGAAPRCDPTKAFGTPAKVSLDGLDVIVDAFGAFQVDPDETRAFLQRANTIRQYDLTNNVLSHVVAVPDLPTTNGFAVSPSGLELLASDSAVFRRYTRASLTATWGIGTAIAVPIPLADASQLLVRASYVGDGPVFYFGRFAYYGPSLPSEWDIVRAAPGDASAADASAADASTADASASDASTFFDSTFQSELHAGDAGASSFAFVNDPVTVDDRTMYFARWGGGPVPHLARATRPTPQAAWGLPVDLPVGALKVATADTIKPYAVTPDDCALYFGYAAALDGGPSTIDGPFVLYVSRRPP
jgi:hypothetical protein